MELVTKNAKETQNFGEQIGVSMISQDSPEEAGELKYTSKVAEWTPARWRSVKSAIILALSGDLGSGKTTFIQGLAKGLGIKQRIISPTFIILRTYDIKQTTKNNGLKTENRKLKTFYHIDLYRLEDNIKNELKNLGMGEIMSDPTNVVAIEWAERAKDYLPKSTKWIRFEHLGGDRRRISY
jgi:tRNA threonylcarbamoyladenosine biosynthesis protein TsaE